MLVRLLHSRTLRSDGGDAVGIVTLVRLVQLERSVPDVGDAVADRDAGQAGAVRRTPSSPMLVTGRPLIVSGMVTAPPEPVYPVMVIVPLLVV